jgi:hypothetical protein
MLLSFDTRIDNSVMLTTLISCVYFRDGNGIDSTNTNPATQYGAGSA